MNELEEIMSVLGDNRLGHLSEWIEERVEENIKFRAENKKLKLDASGHYIRGGQGSHWEGCEETHYDCKILKLELENDHIKRLLKKSYDIGNCDANENTMLRKGMDEAKEMLKNLNCIAVYYIDHPAIARWLKEYGGVAA